MVYSAASGSEPWYALWGKISKEPSQTHQSDALTRLSAGKNFQNHRPSSEVFPSRIRGRLLIALYSARILYQIWDRDPDSETEGEAVLILDPSSQSFCQKQHDLFCCR